jgi:hypothetical protein
MASQKRQNGSSEKRSTIDWKDWLDTGAKYLGALAGLLAIYVAHNFQASLTTTNLINQREEAESSLRATMFSNLIKPLIVTDSTKELSVENEKLLSELLSLNFHENFEFKPLLTHLDDRLKVLPFTVREARRKELRSIARRVIQRQESLVTRLDRNGRAHAVTAVENGCITRIIILHENRNESLKDAKPNETAAQACPEILIVRERALQVTKIYSPNNKLNLDMSIEEIDWENQRVRISLVMRSGDETPPAATSEGSQPMVLPMGGYSDPRTALYESLYAQLNEKGEVSGPLAELAKRNSLNKAFTLTWFDFPLTDYTLLSNGTRFAFFIDEFQDKEFAAVKLLWFPRDFFSPRERPTSFRHYREKPWE